jgi:hypothetical protein
MAAEPSTIDKGVVRSEAVVPGIPGEWRLFAVDPDSATM